ncbi:NADase-type glycan-binding domain-containing protein [Kineosporia babensis]|uniref:NAD glycohydrolase translocation F5/8 type C domain-containing protein n=1 Tax=Kineosporia babensis TaxID=499548 RepID=A0A9X1NL95_9ACTN|nr:hypothetical protein [Kineosporia babensis]MCD5315216.1 hypothetical protein [Kineosporia babensis]
MTCTRCGAGYLLADPECPRCGLELQAALPSVSGNALTPVRTTRDSERPWIIRGVSVVGVLICVFVGLQFAASRSGDDASSSLRPADLPSGVASTGTAAPTTVVNLAKSATIVADRTADPAEDAAGDPVTYGTEHLTDEDPNTAWRAPGFYSDEFITITLPAASTIQTVGLTNGYTKVDPVSGEDRYPAGRRIRSVTWMFDNGLSVNQSLEDETREIQYMTIEAVQSRTVRLRVNQTTTPGQFTDDYTAISELFVG